MALAFWNKVPPNSDNDDASVKVYERDIRDYADDIRNAQSLIERRRAELQQAEEQLRSAQLAFIEHCKELALPIAMEPEKWPTTQWQIED